MERKIKVLIVPLGSIDTLILEKVSTHLRTLGFDVYLSIWSLNVPLTLFDWERKQFRAERVLDYLVQRVRKLSIFDAVIGIGFLDAYVEGLNFVFGLSTRRFGTVFIKRLFDEDVAVFISRVLKEATHELGHTLGLGHCSNPGCVMNYSNSVKEVDAKTAYFCDSCKRKIQLYAEQRV